MSELDRVEFDSLCDGGIFVAGHRGMVGSAITRRLAAAGCDNALTRSRAELDLTRQDQVDEFMAAYRPGCVIVAAARVGGIYANNAFPADFIADNLLIETNLIRAAHRVGVKRLIFLGSSCIYPRLAPQPMPEEALLSGPLEPTNEPYAIAKIAGIKLCESYNRQHDTDYRSIMPTNLYGPNDDFDLETSHVVPALMRRFHAAAAAGDEHVDVWGTGRARREFMHVDDVADAILHIMCLPKDRYREAAPPMLSHINVGTGTDLTIRELADVIKQVTGYDGEARFDSTKPDGAPRKLLDVSKLNGLGWRARIDLRDGLEQTYRWFVDTGAGAHAD